MVSKIENPWEYKNFKIKQVHTDNSGVFIVYTYTNFKKI